MNLISTPLRWLRRVKKPTEVWRRCRIRGSTLGFRYRHRDGTLRDAMPGELIEIDAETYAVRYRHVDIV